MTSPEYDDYYDDYPALTEAELDHQRRMGECWERHAKDGGSFEAAIIASGYCPDLVMTKDLDGFPIDTRCLGDIADPELGACEGHAAERREWMRMSEFERCEWERRVDEETEAGLR